MRTTPPQPRESTTPRGVPPPAVDRHRPRRRLAAVALAGAMLALGLTASAHTTPGAPAMTSPGPAIPDVTWRRMVFRASKLLVTATAEVELDWHNAARVAARLESAEAVDPLAPSSQRIAELSVTTSLLGRESRTRIWLDPVDLAALQRLQIEEGKRERLKLYRFGKAGIFSRRVRPRDAERGQAVETWTDVQEEIVPRDAKGTVSDPAALFYWLSSVDPESLREGQTLLVLSKSLINPVLVRYAGTEETRVDYLLHGLPDAEGNAVPISGRALVHRYSLTPGAGDEDELELLGLEGDLVLLVDAERKIPVRLMGRVSPVGRVAANLKEAWLAAPADDQRTAPRRSRRRTPDPAAINSP